jgi:ABC-type multidrug transport system fused ATPase/permease subunit
VPFIYYSTGYYAKRIEPQLVNVRRMEGKSLSITHEAMSMLRVIIPFAREPYEHSRFRNQGETAVDARVNLTVRQTLFATVINVITGAGTALVLFFGAYQIIQGKLSGGSLLVMMSYVAAAYSPLQQISATFTSLQEQFVGLRGALALLDAKPEIEEAPGAYNIGRVRGSISFEGVHFSYQKKGVDTLKDISFEVQPGQRVAIVGPTGAGKTTLVNLITRLHDPQQGHILLDGIDIRKLTLRSLRENISTVIQEPLLFASSIADNICYGRLDASMEEVKAAAKAANAHEFIMRKPRKYGTKLGERGATLSVGERQRITIARAFLKDAPILILDEPTSSVDSRTEALILSSLERLMVGCTTFMIAHRLSTIRNADVILVLDDGRVVEQGTHDDLLRRGGLYKQLHSAQTGQAQRKKRPGRFQEQHSSKQGVSAKAPLEPGKVHRNGGREVKHENWEAKAPGPQASAGSPSQAKRAHAPRQDTSLESPANDASQQILAALPAGTTENSVKAAHEAQRIDRSRETHDKPSKTTSKASYLVGTASLAMSAIGRYIDRNLGSRLL